MLSSRVLARSFNDPHPEAISLGHPLLDGHLAFAGARLRLNSWLAVAFDLKVFFTVIRKEPTAVTTTDVFAFIKAQRAPRLGENLVRLEDGEAGMSAQRNPVPHGRTTPRWQLGVRTPARAASQRIGSACPP